MRKIAHRIALLACDLCIAARAMAASADSNWDTRFNLPGVDGNVYALATNGNNVYVGGDFISAGGDPTIQRIARWDGTNWFALGQGVNGTVKAIAVSGTTVYVGGMFYVATNTDGSTTNIYYVVKWDGSAWRGFGNGTYPGVGGYPHTLSPDPVQPAQFVRVDSGTMTVEFWRTAPGNRTNEVIWVGLSDGGHQWPNADDKLPFDASVEVMKFFGAH